MITSNGKEIVAIPARIAAAVSGASTEPTEDELFMADTMEQIARDMKFGHDSLYMYNRSKPLSQAVIDQFVALGYLVFHGEPRQEKMLPYSKDGVVLRYRTEYPYTIYWRFELRRNFLAPGVKPFAPGERWWDHREDKNDVQPG